MNRIVNRLTAQLIANNELTEQLRPAYLDGVFLADGKAFKCKRLIILRDGRTVKRKFPRGRTMCSLMHWATHDLPVVIFGESEDMLVWLAVFRRAKALGIGIRYLVADDRRACWDVALRVYPNVIIQLCHAHFLREVERKLRYQHIERRIGSIGKMIDRLQTSLERPGYIIGKRKAIELANAMAEIEHRHEFILDFAGFLRDLLGSRTITERDQHWREITENWFPMYDRLAPDDPHRRVIRNIWRKVINRKDELFAYLSFPDAPMPRTTNALEGWHNQIELRCSSIRGFESPETGDAYLNALTIWRRFRRYTDCRKPFTHLNGKNPLEAAGVNLDGIKNLPLHCP